MLCADHSFQDYACIDQEDSREKQRGIDALPIAATLCNAMISLVDDTYYERAWCMVEVMIMQELKLSYGLHQWWTHSASDGRLRPGIRDLRDLDVTKLKLSQEEVDRPKIDFLARQSKLLGRDR